jgi:biotin carboxyl carrier protein
MQLRKKYILRRHDVDTEATLVRDGSGKVWVETASGDRIEDAVVIDHGRTVSLRHKGRMYVVDVTPRSNRELRALVNGQGGLVELFDELGAAAAATAGTGPSARELRAEMPGMVVEVKCKVGDTLTKGQAIVVLEAMKMQNELVAPDDGVVEEVMVEAGQSVESGALLLRLAEPVA